MTDILRLSIVAKTSAERVAAYRARKKVAGEPDITRKNRRAERKAWKTRKSRKVAVGRPFVGCDGEGGGQDELGRQNYLLFRMGDRELYDDGRRLTTEALLGFICDAPADALYVGFAFGYDVTMILRDLSPQQQERLFLPKTFEPGHSPYVWYKNFDIDYLPRNYIKVRRVEIVRTPDGNEHRIPIKGSQRIIYETFGLFQKSFLKVLKEFSVGLEYLELIARNKEARASFDVMTPEVREYCAKECELLAELMEKLRSYCVEAEIFPHNWAGAGKLSKALHKREGTPKAAQVKEWLPPDVLNWANMAYYGGRFEITRTGMIDGPVYEYDICSAYPSAMRFMPCLEHGEWTFTTERKEIRDHADLYIASVGFKHKQQGDGYGQLAGLPVRDKKGHLYWPLQGNGIYWSVEIQSAERIGARISFRGAWLYQRKCKCHAFNWVEPLYDYRKSIGKAGPGYPIKLGLNGSYGTLAQRKGNGAYTNMLWAGLITAHTRALLNEAIAVSPSSIVMLATDGVYSTEPLSSLPIGEKLGQWEVAQMEGLFIVQPGLYWSPSKRKRKSRGLSGRFFEEDGLTEGFENAWSDYQAACNSGLEPEYPSVSVPVPGFVGMRLALARGKPETSGKWVQDTRAISFDWRNKRAGRKFEGRAAVTRPLVGGPSLHSMPHREFLAAGGHEPWEQARLELEEQPSYIDLSPPWKD